MVSASSSGLAPEIYRLPVLHVGSKVQAQEEKGPSPAQDRSPSCLGLQACSSGGEWVPKSKVAREHQGEPCFQKSGA